MNSVSLLLYGCQYGGMGEINPYLNMGEWGKSIPTSTWGNGGNQSLLQHGGMGEISPYLSMGEWSKSVPTLLIEVMGVESGEQDCWDCFGWWTHTSR